MAATIDATARGGDGGGAITIINEADAGLTISFDTFYQYRMNAGVHYNLPLTAGTNIVVDAFRAAGNVRIIIDAAAPSFLMMYRYS